MVRLLAIAVLVVAMGAPAMAQTTKPSQNENMAAIEARAQLAFDKGDYATALPLFMNHLIGQEIHWLATGSGEGIYLVIVVLLAVIAGLVPAMRAYQTPVATHLVAV